MQEISLMTVQYNQFVLTGGPGIFFRLLLKNFERLILFTSRFQAMIPVAFILGFYVALVFARFWNYFTTIPWVMSFALTLVTHLPGSSERNRLIRRTCMRYIMANLIIAAAHLNVVVKKRFPTFELFVASGVLTEDEARIIRSVQSVHMQPFVPVVWATSLITLARKEGLIKNPHAYVLLVDELNTFRQKILYIMMMDDVCIPLVYTQVAETLVNPMGEDDEDIDINEIIDFNWRISWCVVDGVRTSAPAIVRDAHWRQSVVELPHTERSKRLNVGSRKGSIYDLNVPVGPELRDLMAALSTARQMQMSSTNSPAPSKSTYPNESDSPHGVSDDHRHSFPHTTTTNVVREPIKEEDEELEDEQSGKDLKENKVNDETNGKKSFNLFN
ncbi:unnamed protein product [Schistosoma mattheei]|uniref:Bestrophin homolog n=1 Tax=Schistosoma mattheei TaxID=31246 RepID=A0A3P8DHR1_9TREM|nr:unnamed protein product [Schistosoma mattheei]